MRNSAIRVLNAL